MNFFVIDDELLSACDFNEELLQEGKGIYEVFRVIDGKPLFLKEHLNRFYKSLELGGYKLKCSHSQLVERLKILINSNKLKQGNIQFQLLKINEKEVFSSWITPTIYPTNLQYKDGVDIHSLRAIREMPQLKSINLPARTKANKLISEQDIFEVLLVDDKEMITEGSRSNIFFVKNSQVFTPPSSLILPGITRSEVISSAKNKSIEINSGLIPFHTISNFEAAFLTSTSMKVLPIHKIDEVQFQQNNELVLQLRGLYDQKINSNLDNFTWQSLFQTT